MAVACAALGLFAWGAWLWEVVAVKGWASLAWLDGFPRAAWLGIACAAAAVALPFRVLARARPARLLAFAALAAPLAFASFELGRGALYGLYGRGQVLVAMLDPGLWERQRAALLAALIGAAALTAVGFTLALRWLAAPVGWKLAALYLLALALVLPASLLTIGLFPALGGQTDLVHAIKMGYAAGWTPVLLGAASILGCPRRAG